MENYKKKREEFIITLLLGWLGVHRFMKKEFLMGFIYWITVGVFGICWIIDIIRAAQEVVLAKKEINLQESRNNIQKDSKQTLSEEENNKYNELFSKTKTLTIEIDNRLNDETLDIISYKDLYSIICDYKERIEEIATASERIYNSEYKENLDTFINNVRLSINYLFIIFHTTVMNQILSLDFDNSKEGINEHIKKIKEMQEKDKSSDINLYNIIYSDTQSVINNFDIIHYNFNHSFLIKKDFDKNYAASSILSYYDTYSKLPYGVETKYNKPEIEWESFSNSIVKFKSDEEMEEVIKTFLANFEPINNKIAMIDIDYMVLSQYEGVPHLSFPIIKDTMKVNNFLLLIQQEIDKRYNRFIDTRTKNITSYNEYVEKHNEIHPKMQMDIMPSLTVFITDICSLVNDNEFKENLSKIILKADKVGIKFILMTKMNVYKVNFGMATDFFQRYQSSDINKIFSIKNNENNDIYDFDENMTGLEFEKFSKCLLESNGFDNVEVTTGSHDFGVDVIAYKDNIKYAIQCKKYSSKVGIKAVQEVIGSKSMHRCHVGVVLTNNYFTKSAIELAEKNNIFLWDRNKLDELLKNCKNDNIEIL